MSKKLVLRPPDHFHSFTLYQGCGKPHEYDGSTPIDCEKCVALVAIMSPEERIQDPFLRAPIQVFGETPAEIAAQQRHEEQKRLAASYRLEEVTEPQRAAPAKDEVVLTGGPAYRLGQATAAAGLPPSNPYDHRTRDGKQWKAGYDSLKVAVEA